MNSQDRTVQTEVSRRGFLKLATGALALMGGIVMGIPLVDSLVGPALRAKKRHFAKVAQVDSLTVDQPADLTYGDKTEDAYIRETLLRSVWAVKHTGSDVTVYSSICPHLGCGYNWNAQDQHFECPCHGSVFALDGQVLAGPAPRPLDTLPTKIENGELLVEWERFKLGIPEKVSA
jgi:menaquinol-cytochrome c reductase iron-sulfur subunit